MKNPAVTVKNPFWCFCYEFLYRSGVLFAGKVADFAAFPFACAAVPVRLRDSAFIFQISTVEVEGCDLNLDTVIGDVQDDGDLGIFRISVFSREGGYRLSRLRGSSRI